MVHRNTLGFDQPEYRYVLYCQVKLFMMPNAWHALLFASFLMLCWHFLEMDTLYSACFTRCSPPIGVSDAVESQAVLS